MNEFIKQGGVVMYPLLAFSVIALAIILERFIYLKRIKLEIPERLMNQVKLSIREGNTKEILLLFNKNKSPIYQILAKGIENWENGYPDIEREIEEVKMSELPEMGRRLPLLHFIGIMSPSLGLLGTVTGMIKTFHFLSLQVESQQLAQGISEALITTAFGLSISIPTLAAYYYFMNKIEHIAVHTEKRELELIHYVQKLVEVDAQIQD